MHNTLYSKYDNRYDVTTPSVLNNISALKQKPGNIEWHGEGSWLMFAKESNKEMLIHTTFQPKEDLGKERCFYFW